MKSVMALISPAGSNLCEARRVGAFVKNGEREYRVLFRFIKERLKCGDKTVHVLNLEQRQDQLQCLTAAGVEPAIAEQNRQPELGTNAEIYLPDGRFAHDWILAVLEQLASGNTCNGFPLADRGNAPPVA
jgi:hypothetical protein